MEPRKLPSAVIAILAGLLVATGAGAQQWVPVGPLGGDVRSLAVDPLDPNRIYLGTAEGMLYRSDSAGLVWQRLQPGFPRRGQSLDEIVVSPAGRVLVAFWDVHGEGGGVAVSTNRGRTFTLARGLEGESVRCLALAPSNPQMAVAGTLSGIFASRDGGLSWRRISARGHPDLRNVQSVAVDPALPHVIYAGTRHLPWKTIDFGSTWKPLHAGMIDDSDVFTLTVDRRDRNRVFATACSGIYRWSEDALRWAGVRGIPLRNRRTRAFAQDQLRPNSFYAGTTEGLWISDDDTVSWRAATGSNIVVNALAALPDGTVLIGAEGAGVLRSTDRGRSWTTANTGFSERLVSRIVFDRREKRVLVGVRGDRRHGGVLTAAAPEGPWTPLGAGLEGREILSLAVSDASVLAGTDEGLFSLSRDEVQWKRFPSVDGGQERHPPIADVAVLSEGVLLIATPLGLFRGGSKDAVWQRTLPELEGPASALFTSADDPATVLLATSSGLWKSVDAGLTWRRVPSPKGARINAVALLPGEPRLILAASKAGLYRSADLGLSWERGWGLPHADITSLAVHPDGRTVYVSDFSWGGIYRTTDRGGNWTRLPDRGLASAHVWTLGLDPANPDEPLAAPLAGGLHLFTGRSALSPATALPAAPERATPPVVGLAH